MVSLAGERIGHYVISSMSSGWKLMVGWANDKKKLVNASKYDETYVKEQIIKEEIHALRWGGKGKTNKPVNPPSK